jgi:NAD(P)-dependent dehydrogenase (short-subunit alcohol dehydrogenase family)
MTDTKVVLVTGASRGIGRAAALACARAGMQVIATGRAQKALEDLDDEIRRMGGLPATIVPMDLTDFDAIDRLGGALFQRYGRLDGMIHAAAHLGELTLVAHATPRMGEQMIATNLTASWRLIRSMEPLLIQAPASRVIFFTSGVAHHPRAHWGLYAATKAGVEAMAKCWADEIEFKKVVVTVLNPGGVATMMRKNAFPGEDQATLPQPEQLSSLILELMSESHTQTGTTVHFRETEHFKAWQAAHQPNA